MGERIQMTHGAETRPLFSSAGSFFLSFLRISTADQDASRRAQFNPVDVDRWDTKRVVRSDIILWCGGGVRGSLKGVTYCPARNPPPFPKTKTAIAGTLKHSARSTVVRLLL